MKKLLFLSLIALSYSLRAEHFVEQTLKNVANEPKKVLELLRASSDPRAAAFLKRLKTFELDNIERPHRGGSRRQASADQIIGELKSDLLGRYLTDAQDLLGECTEKPCLSKSKESWLIKGLDNKAHCYPGTNCGYYKCMEKTYGCSEVGFNYFSELAYPTCSSYVDRVARGKFTQDGVDWIYSVMVCLQKGLFEECAVKGNCQKEDRAKACEHIVEFTLEFHPGCYINSGVGVCKLPLSDQLAIWKTVRPYLSKRETIEAFKVVYQCLFK